MMVFCVVFIGILVLVVKYGFCFGWIIRLLFLGLLGEFFLGYFWVILIFSLEYVFVKRFK